MLVPLDGSALAESVLEHVQAFARLTGASVTLVQVVESLESLIELAASWEFSNASAERQEALERTAQVYLTGVARRQAAAGLAVRTRIVVGPPAETIIQTAHEYDLIAMATHGRSGLGRWVFGSVTDRVLRGATVPVLLIRAGQTAPSDDWPRRILVPLDGSALAEQALPLAVDLAGRASAVVILLQSIGWARSAVADYPAFFASGLGADRLLEQAEDSARDYLAGVGQRLSETGLVAQPEIRLDPPAEAILTSVIEEQAELIVMSTHGRGGLGRWVYGSVTDRVLRGASLPVLLVRADGLATMAAGVADAVEGVTAG
jgi:nucleotide-binding universal stress UspA family protein